MNQVSVMSRSANKEKTNTAGDTVDAACFSSLDDTATQGSVGEWIVGPESVNVKSVFDGAGAMPDVQAMMARLKLTGELSSLKKQIDALGATPTDMLSKLKLAARSNELRKQLGGSLAPVVQPEPVKNEAIDSLKAVIAGEHDSMGLTWLFATIQEAVNGLDDAGLLSGDAEDVANEAITHWAVLEEKENA